MIPTHVGIIPDGNRRYGKKYNIPLYEAYAHGIEKLRDVLVWSKELGIKILTVWGFSTENFARSPIERKVFFSLIERKAKEILNSGELQENNLRVKIIGKLEKFPKSLQKIFKEIEDRTINGKLRVNIAFGYGGRQEIIDACNKIIKKGIKRVDERIFARHLYTHDIPDPDLVIRTSGEMRLSGFMPWQIAYSELVFLPCLWPELKKSDYVKAIKSFTKRERRFGR
jgi:tritrans,polycis-undecaprenyl-diphosphate synthase [geranylgeranyl-diphosphate specific]